MSPQWDTLCPAPSYSLITGWLLGTHFVYTGSALDNEKLLTLPGPDGKDGPQACSRDNRTEESLECSVSRGAMTLA